MRVWDAAVRMLHGTLVASVSVAALGLLGWGSTWHEAAGWVAVAAVALRVAWGFVAGAGSRHARFGDFVRSPPATWRYLRLLLAGREPHTVGHNPLGGWMVLALLATVALLGLTGWLYTTDAFWGDETVERIHRALAWALLALVALHIAGVSFTSARQRENLVLAMVTGRKRTRPAADPGDVPDTLRNRGP